MTGTSLQHLREVDVPRFVLCVESKSTPHIVTSMVGTIRLERLFDLTSISFRSQMLHSGYCHTLSETRYNRSCLYSNWSVKTEIDTKLVLG